MPEVLTSFVLTPYTVVYAASFVICLVVAVVAWQRRKSTGGLLLTLLMMAAALWSFFGMLEVSATSTESKILLSKLEYLGGVSVPVFFMLFAFDYAGLGRWLTRRNIILSFIIPAITVALAATNESHGLIWDSISPGPVGSNLLLYGHGPWFWFSNLGYTSFCVLTGGILLARFALQSHAEYRRRTVLIIAGVAAPWLAGFFYVSGFNPFPAYDLTRVAFSLSGILFLIALWRWHLLDILPVARNVVIETIPDGLLVLDRHNRIIDMNRAAREMTGTTGVESIGRPLANLIASVPCLAPLALYESAPDGFYLISDTGRHLEASVTELPDRYGNPKGHIVFLKDITERRRTEHALNESESLYRSLFENMLNGFAYCQMIFENGKPVDFIFITVNRAFGELTGLKDVIGKKVTRVLPGIRESDPEQFEIYGRVALTGKAESFETYVAALDGWFAISVYCPKSGFFVSVFEVITERKRLESDIKQAAADWKDTFDSIKDAIGIIDAGHHIVRVNQAFANLVKMPIDEIAGRHCFEVIHGGDSPVSGCPHDCTVQNCQQMTAEFLEPALGKFVEVSTSPISNDDGRCVGSVHVIKDITERKKTEAALVRSEEALRLKLDTILTPGAEISDHDLAAIIDVPAIQAMMDHLYSLTRVGFSIIDLKGNVLIGTGWQDICTDFHRVNPGSLRNCVESDLYLTGDVKPGEFKAYKCKNGLWDIVTPLFIGGRHVGNAFTGQFFYEDDTIDYEWFAEAADKFGFERSAYLTALDRVPRLTHARVMNVMAFYARFTEFISRLSYSGLKLAKSMADQELVELSLKDSRDDLNRAQAVSHTGSWKYDARSQELEWSEETFRIMGLSPTIPASYEGFRNAVAPDDRLALDRAWQAALIGKPYDLEYRLGTGGEIRWVRQKAEIMVDTLGETSGIFGTLQDITEGKKAQQQISTALAEKELLLKEIHHRVKNNMQVISSMLKLQSRFVEDESTRQMLRESQDRIKSMSLVYNKLYESEDLAHIGIRAYLSELVHNLVHAYAMVPGAVSAKLNVADVTFDLDTAIPVGLLVNELVTNALKYAFPESRGGVIRVSLHQTDGRTTLSVADDGIGLAPDFDLSGSRSLGMRLISALAEHQLSGKLELHREGGTEFRIVF